MEWTSYGGHYAAPAYPFRATLEPTLYIDGSNQGKLYDYVNDIALGKLYEANSIVCLVEGYGDFNSNNVEDLTDRLKMRITYDFTPTGMGMATGIKWTGDVNIGVVYAAMVPIATEITGNVKLLPDETKIVMGSGYSNKRGNSAFFYPADIDCIIHVVCFGPIDSLFEQPGSKKMYLKLNPNLLKGGVSPANGDNWAFGAFFQVLLSLEGDLNGDGKVNSVDLSILAENWLKCDLCESE
jgi:hypothetical protein